MKRKVTLPSRGENNYLEFLEGSTYLLHTEVDSVRVGYDEDNSIYFIDPSGGPYMDVGGILAGVGTIEKIFHIKNKGFAITFS